MSSDFKKLNLDRTLLKGAIQKYWSSAECGQCEYLERSSKAHRATYTENDCAVMVDFLFAKDGTTTINTKIGSSQEVGEQLAIYLKNELVDDSRKTVHLTIKNIEGEVFEDLITFLEELQNEESDLPAVSVTSFAEDATRKAVKAITHYRDSLTLTHYRTTNKLLVQGKPLYGYAQVSYFLSEYTDLNGFLDIVYKGEASPDTVDIDEDEVETALRALLPSAYDKLGTGILNLISTSYMLRDASIDLPDYSCYVFPVLRALEGVMRRLLSERGLYVRDFKWSFGEVLKHERGRYIVKDQYRIEFDDDGFCAALELCYDYYHQQRHGLFHMDDLTDTSRFISTQNQAVRYIDEAIGIIEKSYREIA